MFYLWKFGKIFSKINNGFPSPIWLLGHKFGAWRHRSSDWCRRSGGWRLRFGDWWWWFNGQWLHFATSSNILVFWGFNPMIDTSSSIVGDTSLAVWWKETPHWQLVFEDSTLVTNAKGSKIEDVILSTGVDGLVIRDTTPIVTVGHFWSLGPPLWLPILAVWSPNLRH